MAVTIVSNPPQTPTIISASRPAIIKLTSDKYGTAGVTQFRYLATIVAGAVDLGTKYTVVSESPNIGYIDCANTFREMIALSEDVYNAPGSPLPKITTIHGDNAQTTDLIQVQVFEQYYLSGVFTQNAGLVMNFIVARGFTDDVNFDWLYDNWWRYNGLENFIPFSGAMPLVYRQFTDRPGWNPLAPYLNINVSRLNDGFPMYDMWITRTSFEYTGCVYFPITSAASLDPAFTGVHIEVGISVSAGHSEVVQDTYNIEKTIEICDEDEEAVLMFQDRFYGWSFMSFAKKQYTTIGTEPQRAEAPTGRFRYNVDSSDVILLNTDWMPEQMNPLFRDLIATEQCFLVDSGGDLEAVTIVPNSFRLQTSRNEGLIQYSISVRKSVDNFKP